MILKTKLQIPQVKPNTIIRERLTTRLKDNIDKKLILINAGAGYGKTTLLSQFNAQVKTPIVFYHLEANDSELTIFLSYLTAGLRKIYPRFGRLTRTLLRSTAYPNGRTDMIMGTFINEIVENTSGELLITLDDYHNLDPSIRIDGALNYFISHAPANVHLIIATRQKPNLLMAHLKARNELFELTSEDLKFNRDEIDRLFKDIHGLSLEQEELNILEEHSEGWITSLQLILQSPGSEVSESTKPHLPTPRVMETRKSWSDYFNYFAQEIFNHEPSRIQNFMINTSVLEWLNHDVCNKVVGIRNSSEILSHLAQRNTFVSRMPDGNYRFHNLFRDFLLSKWSNTRLKNKALLKAADYFRKIKQTSLALPYYLEARHYKQTAALLRNIGYEMTNSGKADTVASYIEQLPVKSVKRDAELLMVYSYAQMCQGYPNDAISTMKKAIRLIKKHRKRSRKLAQAYYELGSIHFNLGNFEKAKRWLTKALEVSPAKRTLSSAALLNSLGLIYSKAGGKRLLDATECFRKASRIVRRFPENKGLEASIINNWAMAERKAGNLQVSHEKFLNAVRLLKKEENFSPQFGSIFYNAVRLSLYLGNTKKAAATLKLGQNLCDKYNDKPSLALIWRGNGIYHEDLGDPDTAVEYLDKAAEVFENLHLNRMISLVNKDLCRVYTRQNHLGEAEQSLAAIWKFKRQRDDADAVSVYIAEAQLRIAQNRLLHAENSLTRAIKMAKKYNLTFESFLALLEWARLMRIKGRPSDVVKALRKAVRICAARSFDYTLARFLKEQRWAIGILMELVKPYTLMVLKRWKVPYHVVDVYLFGTPRILVDGKKIRPGAWKTSKALKLSCYLCSQHDKMISREILIEAIWKDVTRSSGNKNLRKAMQHIRQAFASVIAYHDNPVLYRNKKYQFAPDFSVWLDTQEFASLVQKTKKTKRRRNECEEYAMQAINLYQNGFAKGWYDDWIETLRGYYRKKYEKVLATMGDISSKKKNYTECASWYRKLVSCNCYDEEYRRKLWSVLAKLKKFNEIKKDFDELKQVLKKDLKTKPQPQTIEHYNTLVE
ncbi:MAG: tetratricopeptide repeat protein [candidate division WOR-3 bacterium]|jgi:ATP/maltotriose-dependent transcriptional regulator MalT/DNA-binding SARP family transcriptional activator